MRRRSTIGYTLACLALAVPACGSGAGESVVAEPVRAAAPATLTPPPARTPAATPTTRRTDRPTRSRPPVVSATPPAPPPATVSPPRTAIPTRTAPTEIALPAHNGDAPLALLHSATLVGDRGLGCVWIVQGGRRHAPLWPPGFRARFGPLRIYDGQHREVWREGTVRDIGGGSSRALLERVPPRCRAGDHVLFVAGFTAS